jgi:hypothetical protein
MSFLRRWLSWSIDWTVQKNPSKEQGRVVKYSREQGRIGCAAWIALGNARAREAIPGPRARVGLGPMRVCRTSRFRAALQIHHARLQSGGP